MTPLAEPRAPSRRSDSPSEALLAVDGMTVSYPQGRKLFQAVRDVTFEVHRREVFGLVGESGSGKSSLARGLMHLATSSGEVRFDGVNWLQQSGAALRRLRPRMQMVFQDPFGSLDPRMSIRAITAEPLDIHGVGSARERRERAEELLHLVGLSREQSTRKPAALSGGQRQRVAIARALALDPKLVVLDEPISALDVSIQAQVLNLLSDLRARLGLTYLFIVHDLIVAEYFCDRLAVMFGGQIMETGSSRSVFRAPSHPYTRELLRAVPVPEPKRERPPRPAVVPESVSETVAETGCPYQQRCLLRRGRSLCAEEMPALRRLDHDHLVACHFAEEHPETRTRGAAASRQISLPTERW